MMIILYFSLILVPFVTAAPSIFIPNPEETELKGCGNPAELFFLLDSSSSIWSVDFKKQLKFVSEVIDSFDISPKQTRVGVASFSYRYHPNIQLNRFDKKEDIQRAVKNIRQYLGGTNTFLALDGLRTQGFSKDIVRPGVIKVAIVLTDGESSDRKLTLEAAKKLKDEGVKVFSIGIGGKTNTEELAAIASEPTDHFTFQVGNYGLLNTIKYNLTVGACKAESHDNTTANHKPVCGLNNEADVMFLVDHLEIGSNNTMNILKFIGNLTQDFNMKEDKLRAGLVLPNCGEGDEDVDTYQEKPAFLSAIKHSPPNGLPKMIRRLKTDSYKAENGGRISARHMAVVFIDDKLANVKEVLNEARMVKIDDVELFVVAIGDRIVDKELMTLCSSPVERHFIRVPSYDQLNDTRHEFLNNFCHGL